MTDISFRYGRRELPLFDDGGKTFDVEPYFIDGQISDISKVRIVLDGYQERETRVEYWRAGRLHRTDGPAVEFDDGGTEYWVNGKLHRDGGLPAITRMGNKNSERHYYDRTRHGRDPEMAVAMEVWFVGGVAHRDGDEPAYIDYKNGTRQWAIRGKLHRDGDKPAEIRGPFAGSWLNTPLDGAGFTTKFFVNGELHREGGKPAVVTYRLTRTSTDEDTGAGAPISYEQRNFSEEWFVGGARHNDNGPSVQKPGYYEYHRNGKPYRTDGPAKFDNKGYGAFRTVRAEYAIGGKLVPITELREQARRENPDLKRSVAYAMFEMTHGFKVGLLTAAVSNSGAVVFGGDTESSDDTPRTKSRSKRRKAA